MSVQITNTLEEFQAKTTIVKVSRNGTPIVHSPELCIWDYELD